LLVKCSKFLVRFLAQFSRLRIYSVVSNAVVENQNDVFKERFNLIVLMILQLFSNRPEIHRLYDYWEIIRDLQFFWIHRFSENPCWIWFRKILNHSQSNFFPMVINISIGLIDIRNVYVFDLGFVEKVFEKLRIFLCFLLKLFQSYRSKYDISLLISIFN